VFCIVCALVAEFLISVHTSASRVHPAYAAITVIMAATVLILYAFTAFSDPGFVRRRDTQEATQSLEMERQSFAEQGLHRTFCGN
jgi:hypothetical protein